MKCQLIHCKQPNLFCGAFPARPAGGYLPISQIFYTDENKKYNSTRH